jgi:protein SCO1
MKKGWSIWMFVVVVVFVPVTVFGVVRWYEDRFQKLPVLGKVEHSFQFINQDSKAVTEQDWKNKIVVAHFFFTHCPSICPKMMYQLKRVQAYAETPVLINSFTVDPEHDSTTQLKKYAAQVGISGDWQLLTGDKKELYRFARKDLKVVATDGDGGPNDFIHSESLVLIDPDKQIRGLYKGTSETEVNALINDIKKIRAEFKSDTD